MVFKKQRWSCLHAQSVYTHYIATVFWKQTLEMHPWSSLCCPPESVSALDFFFFLLTGVLESKPDQTTRLQTDTEQLL